MCAVINPELDRLARARYVRITTFAPDGTAVATPVWVVSEGGYLQVYTERTTGIVLRVLGNPSITVAPCDARGNLQGDPVEATAAVVDDPVLVGRTELLVRQRYGLIAWLLQLLGLLQGKRDYVAVAIDVPAPQPSA